MIIIGYQGIGKTYLCDEDVWSIDLESSPFNKRNVDWYKDYCSVACLLNKQMYDVYVSSHLVVREELYQKVLEGELKERDLMVIYPSLGLKDEWIQKLEQRYEDEPTDKNYRALMNAKDTYDENILDLMRSTIKNHIEIKNLNYRLMDLILEFEYKRGY